jgi:hypothetical protein
VLVLVHLDDGVEVLLQRIAICREADDREDYAGTFVVWPLTADLEELGCVSGVDVVAGSRASVAREDGEVGSGDAERRAAIVGVATKTQSECFFYELRLLTGRSRAVSRLREQLWGSA